MLLALAQWLQNDASFMRVFIYIMFRAVGATATALLIGLFVARPLIARMFAPNPPSQSQPTQLTGASPVAGMLPAPAQGQAPGAPADASGPAPLLRVLPAQPGLDLSQIEGQVRDSSVKKIGEVVNAHPDEALAIIRTWLHQPV